MPPAATMPVSPRPWPILRLKNRISLRFSLRELLLFMLVCAAFSGWAHVVYRKNQPFRQSYMADYFVHELPQEVAAVRKSLDEPGAAWSLASSLDSRQFPARVKDREHIRLDWSCDLQLPWEKAYRLRCDLIRRIIGQIKQTNPSDEADMPPQTDGRYLGQRTIGIDGYYEDEIQYRIGDVDGELRICLIGVNGKPPRFRATLHEWRPQVAN